MKGEKLLDVWFCWAFDVSNFDLLSHLHASYLLFISWLKAEANFQPVSVCDSDSERFYLSGKSKQQEQHLVLNNKKDHTPNLQQLSPLVSQFKTLHKSVKYSSWSREMACCQAMSRNTHGHNSEHKRRRIQPLGGEGRKSRTDTIQLILQGF